MAQNQWINVTIDPSASKKADKSDHKNTTAQAGAAASNFTISFDSAVITNMTLFNSCVDAARSIAASQLAK